MPETPTQKPGVKTTEHWLTWAGIIASVVMAIVPILITRLPPGGTVAIVLGALAAAAGVIVKYTHGRSAEKVKIVEAASLVAAASAAPPKPVEPTPDP